MKRSLVSYGLLLAAALLPGLVRAQGGSSEYVKTGIQFPAQTAPGKPFKLAVTFDIQSGYHIQAHNAKEPYIPTKIEVSAPKGFKAGAPAFPAPKQRMLAGESVRVFEGKISVPITITPPANATGKQMFRVKLRYQACNERSCLPPADTTLTAAVTLGAPFKKAQR